MYIAAEAIVSVVNVLRATMSGTSNFFPISYIFAVSSSPTKKTRTIHTHTRDEKKQTNTHTTFSFTALHSLCATLHCAIDVCNVHMCALYYWSSQLMFNIQTNILYMLVHVLMPHTDWRFASLQINFVLSMLNPFDVMQFLLLNSLMLYFFNAFDSKYI